MASDFVGKICFACYNRRHRNCHNLPNWGNHASCTCFCVRMRQIGTEIAATPDEWVALNAELKTLQRRYMQDRPIMKMKEQNDGK